MRYLLFLSLFSLIFSFPSYSNTNLNKGFLCEKLDIKANPYLYIWDVVAFDFFDKDNIKFWDVDSTDTNGNGNVNELRYRNDLSKDTTYQLSKDELNITIKFNLNQYSFDLTINRYNLLMVEGKKYNPSKLMKYQCKLFSNKSTFQKKILNYGQRKF